MEHIILKNVTQNNLKGVDVQIPLGSFTVVCGPSGSGKSSLAFETLYAEGQRRYIESLNSYARQFLNKAPKPLVEYINHIPPAIALEQKNSVRNSRSSVGTSSDVLDYLRLLYAKVSTAMCPNGHGPITKYAPASITDLLIKNHSGERMYLLAPVYKESQVLADPKFLKLLLGEGYTRLFQMNAKKKKVTSLEDLGTFTELTAKSKTSDLPKKDFYVVIDRFAVSKEDSGRLVDSMSQAYKASLHLNRSLGGGRLLVVSTDGNTYPFSETLSCNTCHYQFPQLSPQLFSFNSPMGACTTCNGFGNTLTIDEEKVVPNPNLSIEQGALHPFTMPSARDDKRELLKFCKAKKIDTRLPWKDLPPKQKGLIWKGDASFYGVLGLFDYLETKKYKMHVRVFLSRFKSSFMCPDCNGGRLKNFTRHLTISDKSVQDVSKLTLLEALTWLKNLPLTEAQMQSVKEVYTQLESRLEFLVNIGVQYLTLDRPTRTLSGGEYQRLMLAKQLGMGLSETLYVLDEPTIGLHPRDNDRLIDQLKRLNSYGNTLVVVEHDESVIRSSTHIIEMGPGSGSLGGTVMFEGTVKDFLKDPNSLTSNYLAPKTAPIVPIIPRTVDMDVYKYQLHLQGASGHNLKNVNLHIPLNRLVTVTGVSGSGKSTLITQTLFPALTQVLETEEYVKAQPFKKISGYEHLKNVLYIDQHSVGRTERSNPMTYLKIYDAIREMMSSTMLAKERGYTPGTFSLNVDGGRCPVCRGLGYEDVDMVFMDNVKITCEACKGKKFREEILDVRYKNKNIYDIMQMTILEAMEFFIAYPQIRKALSFLKEVGLDYLQLGQNTSTFSGGEIQRIKIARELSESSHRETLYILDEPTTGLHFREVHLLMTVLNKIVDMGGSVILIEHNQDVIARSDYIIDIGPEAGEGGGKIVAQGSPFEIIKKKTHTGLFLKEFFERAGLTRKMSVSP
ncbi:MAG: excinuclease ABC subunit UvrA [Bdellovibrionales bacterium]|nr:excinuclease ABC subunit UvrA [Bdellovibrionales bacterium]